MMKYMTEEKATVGISRKRDLPEKKSSANEILQKIFKIEKRRPKKRKIKTLFEGWN